MSKLYIEGGTRLNGEIRISGSKNASLAVVAGSILCPDKIRIKNIPNISDIYSINELLLSLGCKISMDNFYKTPSDIDKFTLEYDNSQINNFEAKYDIVKKMRASVFVLGPLVARFGEAKIALPGGCPIGARPVDIHIQGLKKLGANIELEDGYIKAEAKKGLIGCIIELPFPSVGATENILCASVLANGETTIKNSAKEPEIVALGKFLNSIGAKITGLGTNEIKVIGVKLQDLHSSEFEILPDRIEAGTYAIASAITDGNVLLKDCSLDIFDNVISIFDEIGIGLKQAEKNINDVNVKGILAYKKHDFKPIDIETATYPGFPTDLQAQIMIPLILANGESKITENIFENRLMHVKELCKMGAKISVDNRTATIFGSNKLKGVEVIATDLRASASLVLASLIAEGETIIDKVNILDRGYENIEMKLNNCGAKIKRISS